MAAIPNFEAEAKAAVGHLFHPHRHDIPTAPATQESHMTTPQQPRLVDSLHAITGEIQQNDLVARLLEGSLGTMLTPQEAASIATLVAGIEQPRRQAAIQVHEGPQQQ